MINKLKSSKLKTILDSMDNLIKAYIELAFLEVDKKSTTVKSLLIPMKLRKIT